MVSLHSIIVVAIRLLPLIIPLLIISTPKPMGVPENDIYYECHVNSNAHRNDSVAYIPNATKQLRDDTFKRNIAPDYIVPYIEPREDSNEDDPIVLPRSVREYIILNYRNYTNSKYCNSSTCDSSDSIDPVNLYNKYVDNIVDYAIECASYAVSAATTYALMDVAFTTLSVVTLVFAQVSYKVSNRIFSHIYVVTRCVIIMMGSAVVPILTLSMIVDAGKMALSCRISDENRYMSMNVDSINCSGLHDIYGTKLSYGICNTMNKSVVEIHTLGDKFPSTLERDHLCSLNDVNSDYNVFTYYSEVLVYAGTSLHILIVYLLYILIHVSFPSLWVWRLDDVFIIPRKLRDKLCATCTHESNIHAMTKYMYNSPHEVVMAIQYELIALMIGLIYRAFATGVEIGGNIETGIIAGAAALIICMISQLIIHKRIQNIRFGMKDGDYARPTDKLEHSKYPVEESRKLKRLKRKDRELRKAKEVPPDLPSYNF